MAIIWLSQSVCLYWCIKHLIVGFNNKCTTITKLHVYVIEVQNNNSLACATHFKTLCGQLCSSGHKYTCTHVVAHTCVYVYTTLTVQTAKKKLPTDNTMFMHWNPSLVIWYSRVNLGESHSSLKSHMCQGPKSTETIYSILDYASVISVLHRTNWYILITKNHTLQLLYVLYTYVCMYNRYSVMIQY